MKPLTIKDLYKECEKQIRKGNGDKVIMISDDDEGNGVHYLWYTFDELDTYFEDYIDTRIAPKDKTVVLG